MEHTLKKVLNVLVCNIPEKGGNFVVAFDNGFFGGTIALKATKGNTMYEPNHGFYPGLTDNIEIPFPDPDGKYGLYNAYIDDVCFMPEPSGFGPEKDDYLRIFKN